MRVEHRGESTIADTQGMAALTGRRPATIRTVCERGEEGYDHAECSTALAAHPEEVVIVALTAAEAERYLGIRAGTVAQWALRKRLTAYDQVGNSPRYLLHDLERLRNRDARRAQLDL